MGRGFGSQRPGYVLIAVLIVIVVLSLTAYQFVDVMTAEYRAAARTGDTAQAKLSAVSGIYYVAAMLSDPIALANDLGGNPLNPGNLLVDVSVTPDGTGRRAGRFTVVSSYYVGGPLDNPGSFESRNGVIDEAAKLNINTLIQLDPTGQVLHDALMKLPNMTEEIADAIVDWVDADDDTRPAGAESSHYLSLGNPYRAKNGPLNSVDELLFVRGVTADLLHGTDKNRNGLADDGDTGAFTRGWADLLTVYGRELNLDSTGALRLYVGESEDMPGLYTKLKAAVGQELADYVMAFKMFTSSTATTTTTTTTSSSGGGTVTVTVSGTSSTQQGTVAGTAADLTAAVETALAGVPVNRKRIRSLMDMVGTQVTLPREPATPEQPNPPTKVVPCPLNDPARLAELLPVLMDKTTATVNVELVPRVNVFTAPREVLLAIPSVTETIADQIIEKRAALDPLDPATMSGAWLLTSSAVPTATFKQMEKYVTGRTMVYRVQAIGYSEVTGGPVSRVEAVIDTNQGAPRILYFRDLGDLDSPRGFEPPTQQ